MIQWGDKYGKREAIVSFRQKQFMIEHTNQRQIWRQNHEDWKWAQRHSNLQDQDEGELAVVYQQKVIAHSPSQEALFDQIRQQGYSRDEAAIVPMLPGDFEVPPDHV